LLDLEGNSKKK